MLTPEDEFKIKQVVEEGINQKSSPRCPSCGNQMTFFCTNCHESSSAQNLDELCEEIENLKTELMGVKNELVEIQERGNH